MGNDMLTVARRLQTPRDVFADRFAVAPCVTGNRGDLQPLPV